MPISAMQDEGEEHFFDEAERTNFIKVISSFKFYRSVAEFLNLFVCLRDICFVLLYFLERVA